MKNLEKYQFVTGLHGNERIPVVTLAELGIEQIVGNPKALSLNKRFIEKDMNASFGTNGNKYEEKLAKKMIKEIGKGKTVIDFHTTLSVNEPFVIVVDKDMIEFASSLGIKKIVHMKYNNKGGHALINHAKGVSVECGVHDTYESYRTCKKVVAHLEDPCDEAVEVYEVFGTITKKGKYENFVEHEGGFVPIFANKNSYGNLGLKARKIKV